MKKIRHLINKSKVLFVMTGFLVFSINSDYSWSIQDNLNVEKIVEEAAVRLANYPQLKDWQVSVLSTAYRMDKNWEPEKKTIVRKTVTVRDKDRTEDIISAIEIEKEKTKDVTEKFRQDALKEKRKREERRNKGQFDNGGGRRELSMDDMFPFGVEERKNYIFRRLKDTELEGISVFILETKAKMRTDKYYDGKYYISKNDYQVIKAELHPAKNPSVLKLFEMEAYFQVIPGGYFVLQKTKVKIHVGLVIKNIRMDAEEEYSDYVVLEE
jgi:hypothetical protein